MTGSVQIKIPSVLILFDYFIDAASHHGHLRAVETCVFQYTRQHLNLASIVTTAACLNKCRNGHIRNALVFGLCYNSCCKVILVFNNDLFTVGKNPVVFEIHIVLIIK